MNFKGAVFDLDGTLLDSMKMWRTLAITYLNKKGIYETGNVVQEIRYSPLTINLPINDNLSVYSNTHYSGKYNFKEDKWTHSIGNFTGVDYKINEKNCISIELQRKNLQNLKDNSSENWDINIFYTHKF